MATAGPSRVATGVSWTQVPRDAIGEHGDFPRRAFAFGCFAVLLALNIALPSYMFAGYPIRGLLTAGLLVFLAILFFEDAAAAMKKNSLLLAVAAGLAVVGTFVSIVNRAPLDAITEAVTEVHLQTAVTILVATILARLCGARLCVLAIVCGIAVSGFVAILQMIGLDAAWSWRETFGNLQNQNLSEFQPFAKRRPMGVSFSPIQLSTQLCLAFAAYTAVRDIERKRAGEERTADPAVFIALLAFFAVCIASGTRSPILGGLIFLGLYVATRRASWVAVLMLAVGAIFYFAGPSLLALFQEAQPRVVRVDDNSAASRFALAYYGLVLFLDNPLGYGFAFKPYELWTNYWHEFYTMASPSALQSKELHNYAFNMLNTYGIGLFLFVPAAITLLRRAKASLIFFVPYIVQIMFHNAGPFWSDAIIWFVVAAISVAAPAAAVSIDRASLSRKPISRFRPARPPGAMPSEDASASAFVPKGRLVASRYAQASARRLVHLRSRPRYGRDA